MKKKSSVLELRKLLGLTQQEFCVLLGVSKSYIEKWEAGTLEESLHHRLDYSAMLELTLVKQKESVEMAPDAMTGKAPRKKKVPEYRDLEHLVNHQRLLVKKLERELGSLRTRLLVWTELTPKKRMGKSRGAAFPELREWCVRRTNEALTALYHDRYLPALARLRSLEAQWGFWQEVSKGVHL